MSPAGMRRRGAEDAGVAARMMTMMMGEPGWCRRLVGCWESGTGCCRQAARGEK